MPRLNQTVRLTESAIDAVDAIAKRHKTTRSEVLRVLLVCGLRHMDEVDTKLKEMSDA